MALILGLGSGCAFIGKMLSHERELNLGAQVRPIPAGAVFREPGYQIWCSALTQDDQGLYHLFYSRWPRPLEHRAWVTHCEIAHAVSKDLFGTFTPVGIALPERGKPYWDGLCTHNPTILRAKDGKYYLYYMGNTGDRVDQKPLNWTHRNNQRIGVAVAAHPNGPWARFDKPVLDVSPDPEAPDALMVSNPAVTQRQDGGFLMIYKAVAKTKPGIGGGPVTFMVALSDSPTGPFVKTMRTIFTTEELGVVAEDPCVWTGEDRYWSIIRIDGSVEDSDGKTTFVKKGRSLVLFQSFDGLRWEPAKHPKIADLTVKYAGRQEEMCCIERPQIFFENGRPVAILFSSTKDTKNSDGSFAVRIPLIDVK